MKLLNCKLLNRIDFIWHDITSTMANTRKNKPNKKYYNELSQYI